MVALAKTLKREHPTTRTTLFSATEIPEDLIIEIFLRLPAKSLIRLRCLSKFWLSIIASSKFIRMHSYQTLKTGCTSSSDIFIGSSRSNCSIVDLNDSDSDYTTAKKINIIEKCAVNIVGCCRGIICFVVFNHRRDALNLIMWNPSTREHWEVEVLIETDSYSHNVQYWAYRYYDHWIFGYDHVNDDFKLVRISTDINTIKVYGSLRNRYWKMMNKVDNVFPCSCDDDKSYVFVDGTNSIHWTLPRADGEKDNNNIIVAFNFETHSFSSVPLPAADHNREGDGWRITALGSLKCCLIFSEYCGYDQTVDVWMMRDYGIKESWIKLAILTQVRNKMLIPIAYSNCQRKLLFMRRNRLYWYDLEKKDWTRIHISGLPRKHIFKASICPTSLLRLKTP
ncbi:hypothetical protein ACH5RR_006112 [Cinchona calisaya]|uniref:F-box domain-containing protein n=1 Tax=Cinchona calisaya TaxID=153742 RepID=A0ABD3AN30_9GENT